MLKVFLAYNDNIDISVNLDFIADYKYIYIANTGIKNLCFSCKAKKLKLGRFSG